MKKISYWLIGVLLLLIITNPSMNAFKEYLGRYNTYGLKREANLFIMSRYTFDKKVYIGVFLNFFKIEKTKRFEASGQDSVRVDSTMTDSAKARIDSGKDPLHILSK